MLFRDLVRTNGSRYTLEAIRRWIETEGPPGFWKDCCETGRLPDAGDALVRIGFTETREGENRIVKGVPAATGAFFRFSLPR
jgi:hypothetical protein